MKNQETLIRHLAWLILLGILCQSIGWVAITYSLPRLPAAHTSFAILVQPVLTIVWGVLLLGEDPSDQQKIGMGLIPGAGGTVSLPRRIGRQRTAWLALTGQRLDAPTALAWNLIDEVCDSAPTRTEA